MKVKTNHNGVMSDVLYDGDFPFTSDASDAAILKEMPNILDDDWDAGPDVYLGDDDE